MGVKIYSSLKDLRSQESDIYEFGESLKGSKISKGWETSSWDNNDEDFDKEESFVDEEEDTLDYPWDDFLYVLLPDADKDNSEAKEIAEKLGMEVKKYTSHDPEFTFFVVV